MNMKLNIIVILLFCNLLLKAQIDSNLYSFFVAGHTYGQPGINNVGFHPPFKQKFDYIQNKTEIKFGILTGDIVSPNPTAQDWDEIDADIDTLGIPVYFAVGNHDMENRPLFESRYGNTYFSFIYQNDLFIILDPNIDEWNISGAQLQFLQTTVNDNFLSVDNIYVFFHQILWKEIDNQFNYILWNSSAGRGDTINFWTDVEPVFHNLPNKVIMFAGDLGASWASNVTYDSYNNITLIASGMGDGNGDNFIVVNVDSNKNVNYDLICLSDTNINCLGELTDYLVVSELNSSNTFVNENSHILFPNPSCDYVNISIKDTSNTDIYMFNMHGNLILEKKLNGKFNYSINTESIAKGVYIVKIINNKNQIIEKLVIE